MGRAADQFRASDVTGWGLVALACGSLAVLSANVSAVIPEQALAGLHASRLESATVGQLLRQVDDLKTDTARLQREAGVLRQRFTLFEQASGRMLRRVGALEVSLPVLLEALPHGADIDRSAVTASIGPVDDGADDGNGSVTVRQSPLPGTSSPATPSQDLPPVAVAAIASPVFAVALGAPVAGDEAAEAWSGLTATAGTLLLGLRPLLATEDDAEGRRRIVAGPLAGTSEAAALCSALTRIEVPCAIVPFTGAPLAP